MPLKRNADEALAATWGRLASFSADRQRRSDAGWPRSLHDLVENQSDDPVVPAGAHGLLEDLLYLLYTSGTTAKPKGIAHTTAGYLVGVAATHHYIFDVKPDSVYWCAADVGWVTGHSYIVYGPLANGTTGVMYEGTPDFPDKDRWWDIVERYKVDILYTAPTAIRSHMKWGPEYAAKHDFLDPAAGQRRRADQPRGLGLVPAAHRRRPRPRGGHVVADRDGDDPDHAPPADDAEARLGDEAVPGDRRRRLRRTGHEVGPGGGGYLVLRKPWPAMLRGIYRTTIASWRPTGRAIPASISRETARGSTRTGTSGCSGAWTTS